MERYPQECLFRDRSDGGDAILPALTHRRQIKPHCYDRLRVLPKIHEPLVPNEFNLYYKERGLYNIRLLMWDEWKLDCIVFRFGLYSMVFLHFGTVYLKIFIYYPLKIT